MTKITLNDMRAAGIGTCSRARAWLKKHDIDWHEFKTQGIEADRVRHIDDANDQIQRLIELAEKREAKRG